MEGGGRGARVRARRPTSPAPRPRAPSHGPQCAALRAQPPVCTRQTPSAVTPQRSSELWGAPDPNPHPLPPQCCPISGCLRRRWDLGAVCVPVAPLGRPLGSGSPLLFGVKDDVGWMNGIGGEWEGMGE